MTEKELIYENGIADRQLIAYLIAKHNLNNDLYSIAFIENAIKYAMDSKRHSRDRAAEFLADIIPETEFYEIAAFFEDDLLTNYGIDQKENFWQIMETFSTGGKV